MGIRFRWIDSRTVALISQKLHTYERAPIQDHLLIRGRGIVCPLRVEFRVAATSGRRGSDFAPVRFVLDHSA